MGLTALLLVSAGHQDPLVRHLEAHGIDAIVGAGRSEAVQLLTYLVQVDVVFTDEQLPDGNWRQVLDDVARISPGTLVVICCHRCPSDEVWEEAAALGAYDLIADGTDDPSVLTVVQAVELRGRLRERRLRRLKPVRTAPARLVEDTA